MPTLLHTLLNRTADDLRLAEARFAVIGGLAVAARAVLRTTQDVDLAIAVSGDDEAEAIAGGFNRGKDLPAVLARFGSPPA